MNVTAPGSVTLWDFILAEKSHEGSEKKKKNKTLLFQVWPNHYPCGEGPDSCKKLSHPEHKPSQRLRNLNAIALLLGNC